MLQKADRSVRAGLVLPQRRGALVDTRGEGLALAWVQCYQTLPGQVNYNKQQQPSSIMVNFRAFRGGLPRNRLRFGT